MISFVPLFAGEGLGRIDYQSSEIGTSVKMTWTSYLVTSPSKSEVTQFGNEVKICRASSDVMANSPTCAVLGFARKVRGYDHLVDLVGCK